MTKSSNVRADFVQPIAVLTLICLVCAALLAYLNSVTKPVIEETDAYEAEKSRMEVLEDAAGFVLLDIALPETFDDGTVNYVTEVYEATNGVGYVFMVTGDGYGGKGTMNLAVSLDVDGAIIKTKTISHEETPGMGSKTADEDFRQRFEGKTEDTLSEVDAITGATISSGHYFDSIASVFQAYDYIFGKGAAA